MKRWLLVAVTVLMGVFTTTQAHAACTLNPTPNGNLVGTWAFKVNGVANLLQGSGTFGGLFTASFAPDGRGATGRGGGQLSFLISSNLSSLSTILQFNRQPVFGGQIGPYGESPFGGAFNVDGSCDHGTLQVGSGTPFFGSFDFYFTNLLKTRMYLVGMTSEYIFSGFADQIN